MKFKDILICTDLDGTLLKTDKNVSKKNLEAIEYFKSEGGRFTFVTGRMPYYSLEYCETVKPNIPIVCINGSGIYDFLSDEYVWKINLQGSAIQLVDYVYKTFPDVGIQIVTFYKTYFCRENSATDRFLRLTKVPRLTCNYKDVKEPIAKIMFCDERPEIIEVIKEKLKLHPLASEFDFIHSERTLYEVLPKNTNKGLGLTKLAESIGIDMNKTIAIGDYYNDISMIKTAKIGVAVSNACDEAKAVADVITVSNNEDAVAKIIEELDSGILKFN